MVTRILVLNLRNIQVPVLQRFINSIEVHVVYNLEYRAKSLLDMCQQSSRPEFASQWRADTSSESLLAELLETIIGTRDEGIKKAD